MKRDILVCPIESVAKSLIGYWRVTHWPIGRVSQLVNQTIGEQTKDSRNMTEPHISRGQQYIKSLVGGGICRRVSCHITVSEVDFRTLSTVMRRPSIERMFHPENTNFGPEEAILLIYNLPPNYTNELLEDLCKQFGTVVNGRVYMDEATNRSKRHGRCILISFQLSFIWMPTTAHNSLFAG